MAEPSDKHREELEELRSKLQGRVLGTMPSFEAVTATKVVQNIRRALLNAYNDDLLENPLNEIYEFVPRESREGDKIMITGGLVEGKKPFARTSDQIRIKRTDGAWLHFTVTLRCDKKDVVEELWAYDFELVFPEGHRPSFVRFDLNEPGHENEAREIRSHMHPSNDDLLLPAPVMSPEELLDVLVRRLRPSRDPAYPRT